MNKNKDEPMKIEEPGFWATLLAVFLPLPPPMASGTSIGFEDEDTDKDDE